VIYLFTYVLACLLTCSGAVCYGLEPDVVTKRRSALTYGVEVLHRFDSERHPTSNRTQRDGVDWCTGVFDTFVLANQVACPQKFVLVDK